MIVGTPGGNKQIAAAATPPSVGTWGAMSSVSSFADQRITMDSAAGVSAWYAATGLISWGAGTVPLRTYDRSNGRWDEVLGADVAVMLRESPNPDLNAAAHWPLVFNHLLYRSNAYLSKIRDAAGDVIALYPLHPDRCWAWRDDYGKKWIRVMPRPGSAATGVYDYDEQQILHIIGPMRGDGLMGESILTTMRHRFGVVQAAGEYQARIYRQGAVQAGVVKSPAGMTSMSKERKDAFARDWRSRYSGSPNAHGVVILEAGWDYQAIGLSPSDTQFLGQLEHAVAEISSWLHIPSEMLNGAAVRATYQNAETHDLRVTKWAMRPWTSWIEGALKTDPDLFGTGSRWIAQFDYDELLRTDAKTRADIGDIRIGNSSWSPNEFRMAEKEAPRSDELGGLYTDELAAKGISRAGTSVPAQTKTTMPPGGEGGAGTQFSPDSAG